MVGYAAAYSQGDSVKIAERRELEEFQEVWAFHNKLQTEQLQFAGKIARIKSVGLFHGGYVLYELENVPGIWHEQCLRRSEE